MELTQTKTSHFRRVEVCGGIASGKSTLAKLMAQNGFIPIFENFQANPFFDAFYRDPVKYAFETEITFLLQHYHQIKVNLENQMDFICDFSLVLDLSFIDVTLLGSERETFLNVYTEIINKISLPSFLIYLKCSSKVQLERIKARGRKAEDAINTQYLDLVSKSIEKKISELPSTIKIITIDSYQKNFSTNSKDKEKTIELIHELS